LDNSSSSDLVSVVSVLKYKSKNAQQVTDKIAVEAPLEIRVNGVTLATLMRTPGADDCLVRGFLVTEGIIRSLDDIEHLDFPQIHQCLVILKDFVDINLAEHQRYLPNYGSCGICSTTKSLSHEIDVAQAGSFSSNFNSIDSSSLFGALNQLNEQQQAFKDTGGIHSAGLFSPQGDALHLSEDIGRHNAVDKVIGAYLMAAKSVEFNQVFLLVSSRLSFEIIQKSLIAGIPLVAALSAPSSLAVELAVKYEQTVIGFLRPPNFNLYHQGAVKVSYE